jgi:septum formation protein
VLTLVLASASPARLATLRAAGVEPTVVVSGVDEDAVLAAARTAGPVSPADAVLVLARAKAEDVVARLAAEPGSAKGAAEAAFVVGCDSMLELDGEVLGKPRTPEVARTRWHAMRGRTAVLHTGHWLVDVRDPSSPVATGRTASTTVVFASVTDDEIDAYVATGEPLAVAGAFTIDGLGGPFVERVEGDHHNVVGISLPLVRRLLGGRGVAWTDLWAGRAADLRALEEIVES